MFDYSAYLKKLTAGEAVNNPFLSFMGMKLEEIREGYARFSMAIRPEFIQGAGIMQGGLSVAFSSETVAHAVMTTLEPGENVTTIELKNNFLSQASKGRLIAEATIFKRGRRVIIVDCIVRDDQGRDISRSTSSLMVLGND
ncbi:MAG: PaaI family thioesterase [Desulfobacteraceae bacterium]|nr:PaaI family thioesterase [Desulfobacteraceae bacterium]